MYDRDDQRKDAKETFARRKNPTSLRKDLDEMRTKEGGRRRRRKKEKEKRAKASASR